MITWGVWRGGSSHAAAAARQVRRAHHRDPALAGTAARPAPLSAMAVARSRARLFARGERSRPGRGRAVCRDQRHGGDARRHASRGRRARATILPPSTQTHPPSRRACRPRPVGAVHPVVEPRRRLVLAVDVRALSRHGQSRLYPDQARALAHGRTDPDPGYRRRRTSAPAGRRLMPWLGLVMLLMVAAGIIGTGLPAAIVLIAVAMFGAVTGIVSGEVPVELVGALPSRLINLFENDLLQALPLYVTMGLLLDRLPVADALYRASNAVFKRSPSGPLVSGVVLGTLLGPMNGSVGASVLGLSRVISPRLSREGVPAATRDALIAVASTLGVLVPPSLVLVLLSAAILSAHTIAVTQSGRSDRVVNTQDIFHSALLPAGIFLALCLFVAWRSGRRLERARPAEPLTLQQGVLAAASLGALLLLLGGVAIGYFFAVEAAAMGAFALLVAGHVSGRLDAKTMRALLSDAMAITGALLALLLAATTFTLVLRLIGTDRLVSDLVGAIPGGDVAAVAVVLAVIGVCAFVLDAVEIIFVIVPVVIPPLLIRVADARWVSVLVLLTLQSSFLLPPFGYALMMVRGAAVKPAPFGAFVRALVPFLLAQWLVLVAVLCVPALVHVGEPAAAAPP